MKESAKMNATIEERPRETTRFWSPTWGMGTLDYQPAVTVFTPDSGAAPITIRWISSRTGQADKKGMPRRKAEQDEWWEWLTFTTKNGKVFSFRRDGAPPEKGSGT